MADRPVEGFFAGSDANKCLTALPEGQIRQICDTSRSPELTAAQVHFNSIHQKDFKAILKPVATLTLELRALRRH